MIPQDKTLRWLDKKYYRSLVTEKQLHRILLRSGITEADCYNENTQRVTEPLTHLPSSYFEVVWSTSATKYRINNGVSSSYEAITHYLRTGKQYFNMLDKAILAHRMPKIILYEYALYTGVDSNRDNMTVYLTLPGFHYTLYLNYNLFAKRKVDKKTLYGGIKNIYECTKDTSGMDTPFVAYRKLLRSDIFKKFTDDLKLRLV